MVFGGLPFDFVSIKFFLYYVLKFGDPNDSFYFNLYCFPLNLNIYLYLAPSSMLSGSFLVFWALVSTPTVSLLENKLLGLNTWWISKGNQQLHCLTKYDLPMMSLLEVIQCPEEIYCSVKSRKFGNFGALWFNDDELAAHWRQYLHRCIGWLIVRMLFIDHILAFRIGRKQERCSIFLCSLTWDYELTPSLPFT